MNLQSIHASVYERFDSEKVSKLDKCCNSCDYNLSPGLVMNKHNRHRENESSEDEESLEQLWPKTSNL